MHSRKRTAGTWKCSQTEKGKHLQLQTICRFQPLVFKVVFFEQEEEKWLRTEWFRCLGSRHEQRWCLSTMVLFWSSFRTILCQKTNVNDEQNPVKYLWCREPCKELEILPISTPYQGLLPRWSSLDLSNSDQNWCSKSKRNMFNILTVCNFESFLRHTVDGRSPAPPGMYKTL